MDLINCHRLRRQEIDSWNPAEIEQAAIAQDAGFPARVQALLPNDEERFTDNLRDPVRGPLFERMAELSRLYLACSPPQRVYIRSRLTNRTGPRARVKAAGKLESFSLRVAVIGLREKSADLMKTGLAGFAIADIGSDARETLMSLTLVWHAAKAMPADATGLFREIAAISGPAFGSMLMDFASRPDRVPSLAGMGWREVDTPAGLGFER